MDWDTAARAVMFFTLTGISLLALWGSIRGHERRGIALRLLLRVLIWVPSSAALGLLIGWLFIWPDRNWIAFIVVYGILGCFSVFMLLVSDVTLANHAVNPEGGAPLSRRAARITCAIGLISALAALLPFFQDPFERLVVTFMFGLFGFLGGVAVVTAIEHWKFGGPTPEAAEPRSDQSESD